MREQAEAVLTAMRAGSIKVDRFHVVHTACLDALAGKYVTHAELCLVQQAYDKLIESAHGALADEEPKILSLQCVSCGSFSLEVTIEETRFGESILTGHRRLFGGARARHIEFVCCECGARVRGEDDVRRCLSAVPKSEFDPRRMLDASKVMCL
jgi:hypothetical protein